jgi:hypothetical protein
MQTDRSQLWMGVAGLALVFGFFMPWIDILGLIDASGWDLVRDDHLALGTRAVIGLCPVAGVALALAAFGKKPSAGWIAVASGAGVLGYTSFKLAYAFAKVTGWGLWLVLAAGGVSLILGLAARRR